MDLTKIFEKAADSMTTPAKTPSSPNEVGLSTCKVLKSDQDFFSFITTAVVEYIDLSPDDPTAFADSVKKYLKKLGITNKTIFAFMHDFPVGDTSEATVTFAIRKAFTCMAAITKIARKEKFYLDDAKKFDLMEELTEQITVMKKNAATPKPLPTPQGYLAPVF